MPLFPDQYFDITLLKPIKEKNVLDQHDCSIFIIGVLSDQNHNCVKHIVSS